MFTKNTVAKHRAGINAVLKKYAEENDIIWNENYGITFSEDEFHFKASFQDTNGLNEDEVKANNFSQHAHYYGLQATDYNKVFRGNNGQTYQIVGIKPNARKYSIVVKEVYSGKVMAGTAAWVIKCLQANPQPDL